VSTFGWICALYKSSYFIILFNFLNIRTCTGTNNRDQGEEITTAFSPWGQIYNRSWTSELANLCRKYVNALRLNLLTWLPARGMRAMGTWTTCCLTEGCMRIGHMLTMIIVCLTLFCTHKLFSLLLQISLWVYVHHDVKNSQCYQIFFGLLLFKCVF
jgi:hypothetical protein